MKDLTERGLWNEQMKNLLIAHNGSIQKIEGIPEDLKSLYKTVWEIPQKFVIDLAADRGAYIDQSQSLNIHIAEPNFGKLTSMHFYGWKKGLKTGMYYLRTRPAVDAIKFTVDQSALQSIKTSPSKQSPSKQLSNNEKDTQKENEAAMMCSLENREACVMCSS